jgi:hypothetical protein
MNQARVQMIIWREAPKKDFLHNPEDTYETASKMIT